MITVAQYLISLMHDLDTQCTQPNGHIYQRMYTPTVDASATVRTPPVDSLNISTDLHSDGYLDDLHASP